MPISFAQWRKNSSGFLISKPHPSLDLPSSETAPLCFSLLRASILVSIIQLDGLSSIFAIKPKPQLSLSKVGEYNEFFNLCPVVIVMTY